MAVCVMRERKKENIFLIIFWCSLYLNKIDALVYMYIVLEFDNVIVKLIYRQNDSYIAYFFLALYADSISEE